LLGDAVAEAATDTERLTMNVVSAIDIILVFVKSAPVV
jgi:hypothetical protein